MDHKKIKYKSPIQNHFLIRTGTISDGSCFFHSLLTSISSTYRESDNTKKRVYNQRLRNQMSSQFTELEWDEFNGMELLLQTQIHSQLRTIWKHPEIIHKYVDEKFKSIAIEMIQQIPFSMLDNHILPRAFDIATRKKNIRCNYIQCIYKYIINYIRIFMSDERIPPNTEILRDLETIHNPHVLFRHKKYYLYKKRVYKKTFQRLILSILNTSNQHAFLQFKSQLSSTNSWANDFYIKYASQILDINILMIDENTDRLYNMPYTIDKQKKCVLLYYIEETHFESIGFYNQKTKVIERSFDYNHPLIQSIIRS